MHWRVAGGAAVLLGTAFACSAFSADNGPGEGAPDGSAARPSDAAVVDVAEADVDAAVSPCPPNPSDTFTDSFDDASRPTVRDHWTALTQDPGSEVDVDVDAGVLHVRADARDAGQARGMLTFVAPQPTKRLCVSFRTTVLAPTSFDGYGLGRSELFYVASKGQTSAFSSYHGVKIEKDGSLVYFVSEDPTVTGDWRPVAMHPRALVVVDIDYVAGSATMSIDRASVTFPNSVQTDAGLPQPIVSIGIDQKATAPAAEATFGAVSVSLYY